MHIFKFEIETNIHLSTTRLERLAKKVSSYSNDVTVSVAVVVSNTMFSLRCTKWLIDRIKVAVTGEINE